MERTMRINVGCGQTPTKGWTNFDNSPSLALAKRPFLAKLLFRARVLDAPQYQFIQFARSNRVEYGDVRRGLPLSDSSVEVLYSSHMLEHLDPSEVELSLKEIRRVLCSKGIIRLAVPDLEKQVQRYVETKDADAFIFGTCLCRAMPRTFVQRLRFILVGARHHQWMYDGGSLRRLLTKHDFVDANVVPGGETRIPNPGPLDLYERLSESVYVEAEKP
jgi:predicted SAM-dependent methyltransferase